MTKQRPSFNVRALVALPGCCPSAPVALPPSPSSLPPRSRRAPGLLPKSPPVLSLRSHWTLQASYRAPVALPSRSHFILQAFLRALVALPLHPQAFLHAPVALPVFSPSLRPVPASDSSSFESSSARSQVALRVSVRKALVALQLRPISLSVDSSSLPPRTHPPNSLSQLPPRLASASLVVPPRLHRAPHRWSSGRAP